ncbi:hypothetical protein FHT39_000316 [Mitsuaria sp. BK045]|uniref:DUF4365 domain-containing protein n=1 Tax=unclassified Roseateles TaxID=2626991 RepID=UPI001610C4DB|nr:MULTISPECIES: DUF4365 domain-containing protein [unclassified Roseateles]MBB3291677.1 hypothetical protein [Mitsuaria sp. BK041]MBB3360894.1 hypothetical protein [Mitsuaria sp. BK045]
MQFPKVGATYAQERRGIAAVQHYAAQRQQIWRETGTGDVGIDGNLEFVNSDGQAQGRIVAVQVKSGPSYFADPTEYGWKFYPEEKHRNYWESFPLPVLLVLHDPVKDLSYWADVRQALRTRSGGKTSFVEVPSTNVLAATDPVTLFETAGVQGQPFISDLHEVLRALLDTRSIDAGFPLSYFDLFAQGLTNVCRSIYYGMDLVCKAAEYNLGASQSPFGLGVGDVEQNFAFDFVRFLLAQGLAQIDYSDCLIDWVDQRMQPHFVAPLTARGRALVSLIGQEETRLVAEGRLPHDDHLRVAQEAFLEMNLMSYFARLPRIRKFQQLLEHGSEPT